MPASRKLHRKKAAGARKRKQSTRRSRALPRPSTSHPSLKVYSYEFNPPPQIVTVYAGTPVGPPVVPPSVNLSPSGGLAPLTTTSGGLVFFAANGIPNSCDLGIGTTFALADLVNHLDWASMYDAYRIDRIDCRVEFLSNSANVNGAGVMPTIYQYWDQDSSDIPTSAQSITGKQGMRMQAIGDQSSTVYSSSFRPYSAMYPELPSPTTAPAGITKPGQWLDCSYPNVKHYGFKAWITDLYSALPSVPTVNCVLRFNWTYHVSFRSPIKNF